MSGFANTVLGGASKLIRKAIQSPNFVTGVVGWSINKDGTAEFQNAIIRGTFQGSNFVVNSIGTFFYSSTPALGNLIASDTNLVHRYDTGTDSFGNTYYAGRCSYAANGTGIPDFITQLFGGSVNQDVHNGITSTTLQPGGIYTPSGSPRYNALRSGLNAALDVVAELRVFSSQNSSSIGQPIILANGMLALKTISTVFGNNSAALAILFGSSVGTPTGLTANNFSGSLDLSNADHTNKTITLTTFADCTTTWTIPANDPQIDTIYTLYSCGSGTQGSTAQQLQGQGTFNGGAVVGLTNAATTVAVSQPFSWDFKMEIHFTAVGAAGAGEVFFTLRWNQTGTSVDGTNSATNTIRRAFSALNTTAAITVTEQLRWVANVGAPTATAFYSRFTRSGT